MRSVAPFWSFEVLLEFFERRPGEDVAETDLLRHFFPDEDLFGAGISLDLFEKHFLLYRRLWLFDDELRQAGRARLWIRGIRSTLVPLAPGSCGWLNDETGSLCPQTLPCTIHRSDVPETNSMKSYYLDWANLESMTGTRLTSMVDQFYQWMGDTLSIQEALQTLGLNADATPDAMRARWKELSKKNHPDRGGSLAEFQRLSAAWNQLKKTYFLAAKLSPTVL